MKCLVQMLSVAAQKIEGRLLRSSYIPLLLLCWFDRGVTVCYLHIPDFSVCKFRLFILQVKVLVILTCTPAFH